MPKCDNCGVQTKNQAHGSSGIILCDGCATGKETPIEQVIEELEADGVDAGAFLRRVHSTINSYRSNSAIDGK